MMLKWFQDDIHGIFRCPTVLNLFEGCYAACSDHFAGEKDHVAYLAPGWDPLGDFHGPYSHQRLIPVLKMRTHNHHMFSFYDVFFEVSLFNLLDDEFFSPLIRYDSSRSSRQLRSRSWFWERIWGEIPLVPWGFRPPKLGIIERILWLFVTVCELEKGPVEIVDLAHLPLVDDWRWLETSCWKWPFIVDLSKKKCDFP